MNDVTHRLLLIFAHPRHTKEKPITLAVKFQKFLEYGPPTNKKGKPWNLISTQLTQ